MRVFCPNCGNENQGEPGARVTCVACTASFDVPGGSLPAPPPAAQPPQPPFPAEPQPFAPPPAPPFPGAAPVAPFAPAPPPPPRSGSTTNTLAVVSFVAGVLCCVPVVTQAVALTCGFMGLTAIEESRGAQGGRGLAVAGIVLGGLGLVAWVLGLLASALN